MNMPETCYELMLAEMPDSPTVTQIFSVYCSAMDYDPADVTVDNVKYDISALESQLDAARLLTEVEREAKCVSLLDTQLLLDWMRQLEKYVATLDGGDDSDYSLKPASTSQVGDMEFDKRVHAAYSRYVERSTTFATQFRRVADEFADNPAAPAKMDERDQAMVERALSLSFARELCELLGLPESDVMTVYARPVNERQISSPDRQEPLARVISGRRIIADKAVVPVGAQPAGSTGV